MSSIRSRRRARRRESRSSGRIDPRETRCARSPLRASCSSPRSRAHPPLSAGSTPAAPRAAPPARAALSTASSGSCRPLRRETASRRRPFETYPTLSSLAPVKLPLRWPNISDSISSSGIAAQFTSTNCIVLRKLLRMQRPRHQLLARSALAVNQNAPVCRSRQRNLLPQRLHRHAVAENFVALFKFGAKPLIFRFQPHDIRARCAPRARSCRAKAASRRNRTRRVLSRARLFRCFRARKS